MIIDEMMIPAMARPLPPSFFLEEEKRPMTQRIRPIGHVRPIHARPTSDSIKPVLQRPFVLGLLDTGGTMGCAYTGWTGWMGIGCW